MTAPQVDELKNTAQWRPHIRKIINQRFPQRRKAVRSNGNSATVAEFFRFITHCV
jgi:hypothetical protein